MTASDVSSTNITDASLGELVATATRDLSALMRQEVALAKAEIRRDVVAAGQGAGMFGGAGLAGLFGLLFLSIAAAYGIAYVGMSLGWAFFTVGALYLLAAGALAISGKKKLSRLGPPEKTIETLKDDAAWARHPTVTPPRRP